MVMSRHSLRRHRSQVDTETVRRLLMTAAANRRRPVASTWRY